MERIKNVGAILCLLLLVFANQAFAQSKTAAEVRGTVLDQQGAAVVGATVTFANVLTGISQKVTTNNAGLYDAPAVPLGKYNITFEKEGFSRFERTGIDLDIETITINATLQVGSIKESITVTGEASMVETDSPQGTTTVSGTAVQDTTNVGRSWLTLLELIPGVSPGGNGQVLGGGNNSVNGEGVYQNEWQLDGAHTGATDTPQPPGSNVPLDSIEEVKVLTSNFGAEYGNGLAVVNVVTKSGTNDWHGSLYEYTASDKWNALNYFATTRTPSHWNLYGATLGGPIRRNKAFFYVAIQKNPSVSSWPVQSGTPTDAMRNGDFSDPSLGGASPIYDPSTISCTSATPPVCSETPFAYNGVLNTINPARIDPVAKAIMQFLPEPNHAPMLSGTPAGSDNYWWTAVDPSYSTNYNFKVDYNINAGNRLSATFFDNPSSVYNPNFPTATSAGSWVAKSWIVALADVWTFSPQVVGEFRANAGPTRGNGIPVSEGKGYPSQVGVVNAAGNVFPDISIGGISGLGLGSIGCGCGIAANSDDEGAAALSGKVTWVKGKHILKFGGEFDRWYDDIGWPTQMAGDYSFSGLFTQNVANPTGTTGNGTGLGWADYLLGIPNSWWVNVNPVAGGRMFNVGAFAQDEYKIRPNLTLTAGLRWMIQSGWKESEDRLADFDPTLTNPSPYPGSTQTLGAIWYAPQGGRRSLEDPHYGVLAPRIGFAWVPFHDWSIRGGYGIYDEAWSGGTYYPGNNRWIGWGHFGYSPATTIITPYMTLSPPSSTGNAPPYGWNGQVGAPPITIPAAAYRTPDLVNGSGIYYAPRNTPIAYVEQYRLDLQHEIKGSILMDVAYVGNSGHHYPGVRDMNQIPQAMLGTTNCTYLSDLQLCRPYPQYQSINAILSEEFGNYNALQVTFRKQFANGLTFLTNYTWSHVMDTLTVGQGTAYVPAPWQNAYDPRADYGAGAGDQRQVLNGNVIYALPFGKGKPLLNQGGPLNYVVVTCPQLSFT